MGPLRAVKDPKQCADLCWVCVDTSRIVDVGGGYEVAGHPMVELPHVIELWSETHKVMVPQRTGRMFWPRKRDVQAVIDRIEVKQ